MEEGEVREVDFEPRDRGNERHRRSKDGRREHRSRKRSRRDRHTDKSRRKKDRKEDQPEILQVEILSSESEEEIDDDPIAASRRRRQALLNRTKDSGTRNTEHTVDVAKPQSSPQEDEVNTIKNRQREIQNPKSDDFDIFSSELDVKKLLAASDGAPSRAEITDSHLEQHLSSNWDDNEGYYRYRIGEEIQDKYRVKRLIGKGVFATVLEGQDVESLKPVAIKIIRNSELMARSGRKEIETLRLLQIPSKEESGADRWRDVHCIQMLDNLVFRNHICIVFDAMAMSMRDVLKKYGKQGGLSLMAVEVYARQLFISLRHLRRHEVLHADIKPDNILVNESKSVLKLADFGSAFLQDEAAVTPILVSRFYRAPEIMLGLEFSYPIDMWAVGCTLFELYTGSYLFPGRDNNHMLQLIQEYRGRISVKLLKKGICTAEHFDQHFNFLKREINPDTKEETVHPMSFTKPTKDLKARLVAASRVPPTERELRRISAFSDLLEKILVIDPAKRITAQQALSHEFIIRK